MLSKLKRYVVSIKGLLTVCWTGKLMSIGNMSYTYVGNGKWCRVYSWGNKDYISKFGFINSIRILEWDYWCEQTKNWS